MVTRDEQNVQYACISALNLASRELLANFLQGLYLDYWDRNNRYYGSSRPNPALLCFPILAFTHEERTVWHPHYYFDRDDSAGDDAPHNAYFKGFDELFFDWTGESGDYRGSDYDISFPRWRYYTGLESRTIQTGVIHVDTGRTYASAGETTDGSEERPFRHLSSALEAVSYWTKLLPFLSFERFVIHVKGTVDESIDYPFDFQQYLIIEGEKENCVTFAAKEGATGGYGVKIRGASFHNCSFRLKQGQYISNEKIPENQRKGFEAPSRKLCKFDDGSVALMLPNGSTIEIETPVKADASKKILRYGFWWRKDIGYDNRSGVAFNAMCLDGHLALVNILSSLQYSTYYHQDDWPEIQGERNIIFPSDAQLHQGLPHGRDWHGIDNPKGILLEDAIAEVKEEAFGTTIGDTATIDVVKSNPLIVDGKVTTAICTRGFFQYQYSKDEPYSTGKWFDAKQARYQFYSVPQSSLKKTRDFMDANAQFYSPIVYADCFIEAENEVFQDRTKSKTEVAEQYLFVNSEIKATIAANKDIGGVFHSCTVNFSFTGLFDLRQTRFYSSTVNLVTSPQGFSSNTSCFRFKAVSSRVSMDVFAEQPNLIHSDALLFQCDTKLNSDICDLSSGSHTLHVIGGQAKATNAFMSVYALSAKIECEITKESTAFDDIKLYGESGRYLSVPLAGAPRTGLAHSEYKVVSSVPIDTERWNFKYLQYSQLEIHNIWVHDDYYINPDEGILVTGCKVTWRNSNEHLLSPERFPLIFSHYYNENYVENCDFDFSFARCVMSHVRNVNVNVGYAGSVVLYQSENCTIKVDDGCLGGVRVEEGWSGNVKATNFCTVNGFLGGANTETVTYTSYDFGGWLFGDVTCDIEMKLGGGKRWEERQAEPEFGYDDDGKRYHLLSATYKHSYYGIYMEEPAEINVTKLLPEPGLEARIKARDKSLINITADSPRASILIITYTEWIETVKNGLELYCIGVFDEEYPGRLLFVSGFLSCENRITAKYGKYLEQPPEAWSFDSQNA